MRFSLIGPVYPYRGGIAHYNSLLNQALNDNDHLTQIVSFKRQFPQWLYPGKSDKDPSKFPIVPNANYILDPFYPWTWVNCIQMVSNFQPNLVAIQWWTTFWAIPFGTISSRLRRYGKRIVYLIHNVLPHESRIWDPFLAKFALGNSDNYIVQSQQELNRIVKLIPDANAEICPLPVFPIFSAGNISQQEARNKLNIPPDLPVLLFFGIVRKYKGLDVLIDAIGLLYNDQNPAYLLITGEFWEPISQYQEQIKLLGIDDRIRIEDRYIPDEEVSIYFSAADVLVAPYTGGTQSAVAKAAIGFGLPIIVTEHLADGIGKEHSNYVKVVPAGDAHALAMAIKAQFIQSVNTAKFKNPAKDDWNDIVSLLENLAR